MAAKFGATIVPFAAIGCDEAVTHHLSADEVEQLQKLLPPLPFKLPWQQSEEDAERLRRIPAARVGVNATMEDLEAFGKVGGGLESAGHRVACRYLGVIPLLFMVCACSFPVLKLCPVKGCIWRGCPCLSLSSPGHAQAPALT
jgi:hypothetical protein